MSAAANNSKFAGVNTGLRWFSAAVVGFVLSAVAAPDLSRLPPPSPRPVDFTADIKPIFAESCLRCHGSERPKSRFRLDNRESALRGGTQNTNDIVPGDSVNSALIHYVAQLEPDLMMPPEGKGQPLTTNQVALLRAWIDQGAPWGEEESYVALSVAPAVGFVTVHGNEGKFRQHQWLRDGWRSGVESFELIDNSSPDVRFSVVGRALTDDYKADLLAEKRDLGFFHFGFEQFRKYDSDTGGYSPLLNPSITNLNQNLHLDDGHAAFDLGLTLPNWPRMVLGYEYQYRHGDKSTLEWGTISQGVESRIIYPGYKKIDERTHILKFDVDYERDDWRVENNFRGEWNTLNTRQENVLLLSLDAPGLLIRDTVEEGWKSFQGMDTVRAERQFKDWLFVSAGYLYSHLSADADFSLDEIAPFGFPQPNMALAHWQSDRILLERESNVGNVNALLGPWQGGTLTLGVQGEWTETDGTTEGFQDDYLTQVIGTPVTYVSDTDRAAVDETAALRFTRLPFTTLYAETRLQQECIRQKENAIGPDTPETFMRDTEARSDTFEARAGFDTSPWSWLKLGSYYRWRDKSTTYDDGFGNNDPVDIFGYPTFISARDLETQEMESRLTLRPIGWLKTTLTYRLVATDYHTTTEPLGGVSPGGEVFAGNYDARIYSANFTLTPWQRLYFYTTVSYQDVRSAANHDFTTAVVPYQGETWSVLCHGRYALTKKTDLTLGYSFSTSNFRQNNVTTGLPLGIEYDLHGLQVGLISRCTKNLTTKLQYGFYRYSEPTSGGANDYTAHAIFASLNLQFN